MKSKVMTVDQAVALIKDGDTLVGTGIAFSGVAEEIFKALETSFLETGHPKDLNGIFGAGQGNWAGTAWDHLAHEGMVKRFIGGHYGTCIKLGELVSDNKLEAYNLPQGIVMRLFQNSIRGVAGEMTKIGLKTFVDPRLEGGKLNQVTTEDIVHLVEFQGEEYLYYDTPKMDVAIIRGTIADTNGNVTLEDEILPLDMKAVAMAVKAQGGKVIVQVKEVAQAGSLMSCDVAIPGVWIDAVVVSQDPLANHRQTWEHFYNPSMSGKINIPTSDILSLPLDEKKVICRRGAAELRPGDIVNLGIGTPEGVSNVANEEGLSDQFVLTSESGVVAGIPMGGLSFGAVQNAWGSVDSPTQFDYYDGGGLDITYLGLAQVNAKGDVNVSKFGSKVTGCGGFINISQNTQRLIYCGSFTAGGLKVEVGNGKLTILQEGKSKKFTKEVQQVTYSGEYGASIDQQVLYVTERAVFKLTIAGIELVEIAPGVDLEKDIVAQMEFRPLISSELKLMDPRLFSTGTMGLKDHFNR